MATKQILSIILAFFNLLYVGTAYGATEDVSIVIFDQDGSVLADGTNENYTSAPITNDEGSEFEASISTVLTMSFAGDVTIGSNVQHRGTSIFDKELEKHAGDTNFTLSNVKDIFETDDITMVNFEGTLTTAARNPDKSNNSFLFRADPSYVTMLSENGVETVSLENNHILDMGNEGLSETKQTLLDAGIAYACEDDPTIITIKGIKVGSLAYQTFDGRHDELIEKVPKDIQALRDLNCQVIIVSYHWGKERDYAPNDNQIRLGRATIDAGADLVIGHHSHRINPIEYYKGRYICYSLGNFCFAGNNKPDDMSTFIFQIRIRVTGSTATSEQMRIIPCRISSSTKYNDFIPTPYSQTADIEMVIDKLMQNSSKLEYAIDKYPLAWSNDD